MPQQKTPTEKEEDVLLLEEPDARVLFHALTQYKPTENEMQRYELLLEELEMILTTKNY